MECSGPPGIDGIKILSKIAGSYNIVLLILILVIFINNFDPINVRRPWAPKIRMLCRVVIRIKSYQQQEVLAAHFNFTSFISHFFIYWPGIDNDIDNLIVACQTCQDCLPSNVKEPLIQTKTRDTISRNYHWLLYLCW